MCYIARKIKLLQTKKCTQTRKRAHEKIELLEESVQHLQEDVLELQQKLEIENKRSLLYKARWWRMKQKLDQKEDVMCTKDNAQQILELEEKIDELEQMNVELHDMHVQPGESKIIKCFCNGRFTDEIRECCINLLAMNVGINNVSRVISCVLSLCGAHNRSASFFINFIQHAFGGMVSCSPANRGRDT